MRRYWLVLGAAVLAAVLLAATVWPAVAAQQKRITVTEHFVTSQGEIEKRAVRVPCSPRRVVVLGTYQAEILKALGQEKRVVAVTDSIKESRGWLKYVLNLPSVGSAGTPNIEKIVSLKPDLVLEWNLKPDLRNKLTRAGIPVMRVYGYKADFLLEEIQTLGLIFNCRERADAYAAYIKKHWRIVQERTKNLKSNQKVKVYWEDSTSDWRSAGPGHGAYPLIKWAGGISIASERRLANPIVTPEWVAAKNPQVIIKSVSPGFAGVTTSGIGFEAQTSNELKKLQQRLMSRPALKNTSAVKQKRVYLISSEISHGPGSVVGAYYISKWLHPELFKDIDPKAVHREMLKKFYGEELKGVWVYPSK